VLVFAREGRARSCVYVVVREAGLCESADAMSNKVRSFLAAYNDGEPGLVDRFFAPPGAFQWYSEYRLRQGAAAYDRSTLKAYLTGRHARGDRLRLVSLTLSGSGGDFAFSVRRTAGPLLSKGKIDCTTGLFVVWSLGPNPGP
jgi:hypothetical protein